MPTPSGSSSPFEGTAPLSQSPDTPSRPTTPTKRSLSKSLQRATIDSTPATRRRRLLLDPGDNIADSSSSDLSEVEQSIVAQHLTPRPESPLTDVVSDFDDEPAAPKQPSLGASTSSSNKAPLERRTTRSAAASSREAAERLKLEQKLARSRPSKSYATRSKSSTPQIIKTSPASDDDPSQQVASSSASSPPPPSATDPKPVRGKAKREAAKQRRHLAK